MSATITVIDRSTVERINEQHRLCEQAWETAKDHAIVAGRLLSDVKAQLRHGEFGAWLEDHFDGSPRTAQTYMQIANAPAGDLRNAVADSPSLRQARDAIARPKPPSQSDTIGLLRQLGAPAPDRAGEVERVDTVEPLWTPQQERKLARACDHLADSAGHADAAKAVGLSRFAVNDALRKAAIEARHAMNTLEELAFGFE